MKKILYTFLISLPAIVFSQNKKVGINTDKPQQTLDVEGTMRIAQPGTAKQDNIPLAWNPKNQQIVKARENDRAPFYSITFRINMSKNGSDFADGIDLGIDATKYVAVLTQTYLVKQNLNYDSPNNSTALIEVVAINDNGNIKKVNTDAKKGWVDQYGALIEDGITKNQIQGYKLAFSTKDTRLLKENNTYLFYGDFKDVETIDQSSKYTWIANVLIIDKEWVKATDL